MDFLERHFLVATSVVLFLVVVVVNLRIRRAPTKRGTRLSLAFAAIAVLSAVALRFV